MRVVFLGGPAHGRVVNIEPPFRPIVMVEPRYFGSNPWDVEYRQIVYRPERVSDVHMLASRAMPMAKWRVRGVVWLVYVAPTMPTAPSTAATAIALCRAEHLDPETVIDRVPTMAEFSAESQRLAASDALDEREQRGDPPGD